MSSSHTDQREALNRSLAEVQGQVSVSSEFFPPRTSEMEQTLRSSINHLSSLKPKFALVTYGANPGERDCTHSVIKDIKDRTGLEAALRLTCIDATRGGLHTIAQDYWNSGIRHAVALRDDLPLGSGKPDMYASDLVTLLKDIADFDISVAAYPEVHPEMKSTQADLLNLRCKVGANTNHTITQFLFDMESYLRFRDRCTSTGTNMEIILGILPVSNFKQAGKSADMTNVRIPSWMLTMFGGLNNGAETRKLVGVNIVMDMVKILSHEGVKGFRFYILNCAEMSYATYHTLGVGPV